MPTNRLKEFLDSHRVHYESIPHVQTFTAQRTAQSTHIKGKEMAKTVIVKIDGLMCMAVIPADHRISLEHLKDASGAESVELATEQEFCAMFPQCEVGAMPPFGNLFGMDVFVDNELTQDEEIAFNAGTHTEVIKMRYQDFVNLVQPEIGALCSQ